MIQKKIGVILGFLSLIILLLGFVSAQNCNIEARSSCSDYIVMGLSSQTNAHGELASEGNYNYVLCCDFGSGNTTCDGTNKIMWLSDNTNAHAEIPEGSIYTIDVCYENLNCTSSSGTCTSEYPLNLLSLSANNNAHIGEFDEYSVKICCKIETIPGIKGAYWANQNDPRFIIYNLEVVPEETQVAMVLKNAGLPIGAEVIFEIYEDDFFTGDDEIRTGSESIRGNVNEVGDVITYWTITEKDLLPSKTLDFGEFYFRTNGQTSGYLSITISGGTCIGVNYCSDYTDEIMCEEDTCGKAEISVESSNPEITCGEDYICECFWNGTDCGSQWTGIGGPPSCGDGNVDIGETCDGGIADFNCSDFGFSGGVLSCDLSCNFDTSLCTGGTTGGCGNDVINTGEQCDGNEWGSITGCSDFGFSGGVLDCYSAEHASECQFDTSLCVGGIIPGEIGLGTCLFEENSNDDCTDGFLTYSWIASIDWPSDGSNDGWSNEDGCINAGGDALSCVFFDSLIEWHYDPQIDGVNPLLEYCNDGSNTISCPAQAQLQFFGFYSIIVTLAVIALIYILLIPKVSVFKKRRA